jgi:hypothetical protein
MLGMYLRSKIAIVVAILGLLVLGSGIGQRTIWLPPATITAAVGGTVTPAPLTVIGPDVLKAKDGHFTMTIKSAGPIQLAVAQQRDIAGWVGDAAYTSVTGVNDDFSALTTESKTGAAKVPNPAGSDMWVSEEKATGEMTYTWQEPGHGDWALLLSSDGTAPAPTDISLTTANEAGTPWAVPLMIIGSALLAVAALLFFMAPRKVVAANSAPVGRRAAGKAPSDPATGAMEVAKIVAAKEGGAETSPKPATIAEVHRAAKGDAVSTAAVETPAPDAAKEAGDAAALPAAVFTTGDNVGTGTGIIVRDERLGSGDKDAAKDTKDSGSESVGTAAKNDVDSPKAESSKADSLKDESPKDDEAAGDGSKESKKDSKKKSKKDNDDDGGTGGSSLGTAGGGKPSDGSGPAKGDPTVDKSEFSARTGAPARRPFALSVKARWGAALAAVLVAGSVGPAMAADPTTPAPTSTGTASPSASATASATQPAVATPGFPVLLDSQVQRIAASVATVVAAGDNAKNAKELQSRVAGMALDVRAANYKIRSKLATQAAPEPVNSTTLRAKVVTTTSTWPRSAMIVTQGDNNALPQLLTLVQNSAREQYKLVNATPLLPGQTFPTVDKEGTASVPMDSATGLLMSPKDAIAALSDRMTKSDSKFKATFKDSVYISSVLATQANVLKEAKDASYVFSHKANNDSAIAMSTADGGAMVVVGYTFGIDATSKADAKLTIGPDAAVFAGGTETTKGFVLSYAEPVVMYIPPADAKGQITIVSATRDLVGAKFK